MSESFIVVYVTNPQVKFSGNWTQYHDKSDPNSITIAYTESDTASGSITFNGSQIALYGSLIPGTGTVSSSYSLDGSSPVTYTSSDNVTAEQDEVAFFTSPSLSTGEHQLIFNVTQASSDTPFILDYLIYEPSSSDVAGASYTTTSLGTPTSIPTSVIIEKDGSNTPVGAIVGGVVGGVAGLIIITLLFFFLFRRRRQQPYFYHSAAVGEMLSNEIKPAEVTPYPANAAIAPTLPSSEEQPFSSPPASEVGGSAYAQSQAGYSSASGSSSRHPPLSLVSHSPPPGSSPNQLNSKAAQAGLLSVAQSTYHADSGVRFDPNGGTSSADVDHDIPVDVPPSYTED
ncbi:hypothetical protein WOLCODRAFT_143268 [Wolfiporia cocos MD-104 SS10]|uniref:Epidermal growth factor receptor-like transmembrane-juxtamembrane segment domain-containing protein n=1 Tax=Wolfiporia cocos (strain MD-104) TaxID=742152 RepID=A0A2H3JG39_WOLCO|nr:hypothetical protein WOLCODRAFT_143268 [Wolfiporia cocos MD-104 SS10]